MAGSAPASEANAADAITVRKVDASNVTLNRRKVAALLVMSNELLREFQDQAEAVILRELKQAVASGIDAAFIAALTGDIVPFTHSGSAIEDAQNLMTAVGLSPMSRGFWIAGPSAAIRMATAHNGGTRYAPDVSPVGGTFMNLPLYVSGSGTAVDDLLILVDGSRVAAALGEAEVSYSAHADVEADDAPAGSVVGSPATIDPLGATARISLWQQNAAGIRCRQFFGVARLRANACAAVFTGGSPA